jgi:hypothetical protein
MPMRIEVPDDGGRLLSVQVFPERVKWKAFLKKFPKKGDWTKPCETELSWDDFTVNMEAGKRYEKMRNALSPEAAQALDKLVVAVCVNGFSKPKPIDHSSLYKPHCEYEKEDFQYGEDCVIPRASPEQVAEILAAAESIAPEALAEEIGRAWKASRSGRFDSAAEYVAYLANWIEILREIRDRGDGLTIDLI